MRNHAQNIAKGILAIFVWVGCYVFIEWYRSIGFIEYLKFALPFTAILCIIAGISEKFRTLFSKYIFGPVNYAFATYEEKMDWVGFFFVRCYVWGGILFSIGCTSWGFMSSWFEDLREMVISAG